MERPGEEMGMTAEIMEALWKLEAPLFPLTKRSAI
jgi:hypothetical protein